MACFVVIDPNKDFLQFPAPRARLQVFNFLFIPQSAVRLYISAILLSFLEFTAEAVSPNLSAGFSFPARTCHMSAHLSAEYSGI